MAKTLLTLAAATVAVGLLSYTAASVLVWMIREVFTRLAFHLIHRRGI
jgi:hypothetical protein